MCIDDCILPLNIYTYLQKFVFVYFESVEQIAEMADTVPCYLGHFGPMLVSFLFERLRPQSRQDSIPRTEECKTTGCTGGRAQQY